MPRQELQLYAMTLSIESDKPFPQQPIFPEGLSMKNLLICLVYFMSAFAWASPETTSSVSTADLAQSIDLSAKSKNEALSTESIHYSLPRLDMTYMELGAYNQRQNFKSSPVEDKTNLNNQVFYFKHSRGLMENLALDFNLDYFLRDEKATALSSGVNELSLGLRSRFEAMEMKWIYGAHLIYLPDGEKMDSTSKLAANATIGFEEAVDIARWGVEAEVSTKDSAFFRDQFNLIGFFEMPFVKQLNMGVSAGMDITKLSANEQNNFVKVYGQYVIDPVSSAQASLRQNNEKSSDLSITETEIGLAMTRVF